jgi:hypothetical protein
MNHRGKPIKTTKLIPINTNTITLGNFGYEANFSIKNAIRVVGMKINHPEDWKMN